MNDDSPKHVYTYFFTDGTKKVVETTKELMLISARKDQDVLFVVTGTDTDRYIFKNGLWTVRETKGDLL